MPRRVARILFRIAGWLLTPLVLVTAAAIGAFFGLIVAPRISAPNTALAVTAIMSLISAVVGLILWLRLLREHPELRHTLEMAVDGSPDSPMLQAIIHPDETPPGPPS